MVNKTPSGPIELTQQSIQFINQQLQKQKSLQDLQNLLNNTIQEYIQSIIIHEGFDPINWSFQNNQLIPPTPQVNNPKGPQLCE